MNMLPQGQHRKGRTFPSITGRSAFIHQENGPRVLLKWDAGFHCSDQDPRFLYLSPEKMCVCVGVHIYGALYVSV